MLKAGLKGKITVFSAAIILVVLISVSFLSLGGVPQVAAPPAEIIVDNSAAVFSGSWPASTSISGYYGSNYQSNEAGTGTDTATWLFILPDTGVYEVFAMWSSAASRASDAKYTVNHAEGSTMVTKNQEVDGGSWQSLGLYPFNGGLEYNVRLSDDANGYVIADAIRVVPADTTDIMVVVEVKVDGEILPGLISIEFDMAEAASNVHNIGIDERIGVDVGAVIANGTITVSNLYSPFDTMLITGVSMYEPFQLTVESREIGQSVRTIFFDECYLVGRSFYGDHYSAETKYYFNCARVRFQ